MLGGISQVTSVIMTLRSPTRSTVSAIAWIKSLSFTRQILRECVGNSNMNLREWPIYLRKGVI